MIACCTFDTPILGPTFAQCPDLSIEVEGLDPGKAAPLRLIFWARGVSAAELDDALAADDTVIDATKLTTADDAILYQSMHPEEMPEVEIYEASIANDALLLAATSDGDGWDARMRIPDRESLSALCDRCKELGVQVQVNAIRDRDTVTRYGFGLTPSQREIVALAWDKGYFSVPRESSLADLAGELGISQQAASERLRRGLWVLVSNTVCERDEVAECDRQ